MGLAGPKENTKISKDPRNTFWSRDTSRFGHQYLANLGWEPGQKLGDVNSSYHKSGHITEASATGVKIVVKDDNLGIGAKKGAQHDECTGLLGLQGLLGRLNGNEKMVEQVRLEEGRQKQQWIQSKWGMRFVRGEVWVADDITKLRERMKKEKEEEEEEKTAEAKSDSGQADGGKAKKRKRDADGGVKNKKRSKKSKSKEKEKNKPKEDTGEENEASPTDRESKRSKSTSSSTSTSTPNSVSPSAILSEDEAESKEERRRKRKAEKKRRKEKKEGKRKDKEDRKTKDKKRKVSSGSDSPSEPESEATSAPTTRSVTPASAMNGRHAVRARFIAAKRSAMLDAASLNEILMIKA